MKLEEGMYVRTNIGMIDIIRADLIGFDEAIGEKNVFCEKHIIEKTRIVKASHNIIDLIEVGDYVNGELVLEKVLYGNNAGVKVFGDIYYIEDIKSIVTKECFESMSYEVSK